MKKALSMMIKTFIITIILMFLAFISLIPTIILSFYTKNIFYIIVSLFCISSPLLICSVYFTLDFIDRKIYKL